MMKTPPQIQLAFVRRLPAWRVPMKASVADEAPPKLAASPPPFPLCSKIAATRMRLSSSRRPSNMLYSISRRDRVEGAKREICQHLRRESRLGFEACAAPRLAQDLTIEDHP